MVKQLIKSNPKFVKNLDDKVNGQYLNVAECFYDTIQGEGIYSGQPAIFLRLKGCTLNCIWCDSSEVWRQGNPYTVEELLELFQTNGLINRLKKGHHLVLTGGSPLLQQEGLTNLIDKFIKKFGFKPFIEVENECTIMPTEKFASFVDCWNNSPKLENSNMPCTVRFKPEVLKFLKDRNNSWFKFVISNTQDWNEIRQLFLVPKLMNKKQIILMPEGIDRDEIKKKYEKLVKLCCEQGVRLSDRLHVTIWNMKTGV